MKYLSLFSGIAGFELGIQYAYDLQNLLQSEKQQHEAKDTVGKTSGLDAEPSTGLGYPECIGFSEINPYAIKVYQSHFPTHHNYGDITQINADELPDFDLLVGGFPCQSFSIAGKRRGFDDTRGTLFFDIARILKEKHPRLFLLENVKGLLSHNDGRTFKTIIATLDELGYDLQWQVLNSKNHGVPQNRERIFIVGNFRGTSRPKVFPFGGGNEEDIEPRGLHETDERRVSSSESGQEEVERTGDACNQNNRNNPLHECGSSAAIRRLTPIECARLQGFPDSWCSILSDSQAYKCYGNAVSVPVIKHIVEKLLL